jgi:hypothetical protein
MEPNQESSAESRPVITVRAMEIVVAVLLLVLGVVTIFESRKLGAGWGSDGPGAGYFPFYIGLIISVSALGVLFQSVVRKMGQGESFVDREQLKRVLSVLIPAAVYVLAIMVLGLYVASALYIALFMIILGKYLWIKSVLAAVLINALFFMMFEVWFKVPLYKGALNPLGFLGY